MSIWLYRASLLAILIFTLIILAQSWRYFSVANVVNRVLRTGEPVVIRRFGKPVVIVKPYIS